MPDARLIKQQYQLSSEVYGDFCTRIIMALVLDKLNLYYFEINDNSFICIRDNEIRKWNKEYLTMFLVNRIATGVFLSFDIVFGLSSFLAKLNH